MTSIGGRDLFDVLEATWPAAERTEVEGWIIRNGQGGGQRVSAATQAGPELPDIGVAESTMRALGQQPIFMVREGETALDHALEERGYVINDPSLFYACPIHRLTQEPLPRMTAFAIWPPLSICLDIWRNGNIGQARIDIMHRVTGPRTALLARAHDRAAGVVFVAIARKTAMIHALEVVPTLRRQGVAINMMCAAAHWAQERGAETFSLAVTAANAPANALYCNAGLGVVGRYHYRIKKNSRPDEAERDQKP